VTENKLEEEILIRKENAKLNAKLNAKSRSKSLIRWVSWVCSYWAVRFREVGVLGASCPFGRV